MSAKRRLIERAVAKVLDRLAGVKSKRARAAEAELRKAVEHEHEVRNAEHARMARLEPLLRLRAQTTEALALLRAELELLERDALGPKRLADHRCELNDWDAYETARLAAELEQHLEHVDELLSALDEDLGRGARLKLALDELQRYVEEGAALAGLDLDELLAEARSA